ncbi:unnamed protein product, partial [Ixodes persulcatus]
TFTPTLPHPKVTSMGSMGKPRMTCVARATKSQLSVLDTNGKERDTRRLHSITFSWLSSAVTAAMNGPLTNRACPMAWQMARILVRVSGFRS